MWGKMEFYKTMFGYVFRCRWITIRIWRKKK